MCYWKALPQVPTGGSDVCGHMTVHGPCEITCHMHPLQVRVEAKQSNIPLYQLAKKYAVTWHPNSEEPAGSLLGRSLQHFRPNINLIVRWDVPILERGPGESLVSPVEVFLNSHMCKCPCHVPRHSHYVLQSECGSEQRSSQLSACPHQTAGRGRKTFRGHLETRASTTSLRKAFHFWWWPNSTMAFVGFPRPWPQPLSLITDWRDPFGAVPHASYHGFSFLQQLICYARLHRVLWPLPLKIEKKALKNFNDSIGLRASFIRKMIDSHSIFQWCHKNAILPRKQY